MKNHKVIGRKIRRVTSIILLVSMIFTLFQVPMYANNVANVTANEKYFSKAVSALTTLGIFEGYPDGSMGENNKVTRAEMATIAVRLLGLKGDWETRYIPTKLYPDVGENHWAVKYLSKAYEATLAVGDTDGNFRADDDVTLVEAIKMILVAGGHGYDKDGNPLEWYEGYKKVAKESKMLDGISCGDNEAVSRGAIILMVYKMLLSDVTMPEPSLEEGTYVGMQEVELSTDLSNAKIYYTLDGNEPDINSAEYKKAIKISETTTLKAITVKDSVLFSDVLEVTYTITDKVEEKASDEKNSTNKSEGDIPFLLYIPSLSPKQLQPSQTTYSLTVIAGIGGMVAPISDKYASGSTIPLTAIPYKGYKFVRWTSSSGGIFNNSSPITTFTMPSNNTIITAIFEVDKDDDVPLYLLTVIAGEGGTVAQVSGKYASGTAIPLTAIPNEDYKFVNWTSSDGGIFDDINSSQTNFIMPGNNTTVTANFTEIGQGGGYVRPSGSFTFDLTSSTVSNVFTLDGTITCNNNLTRIMYQVYSSDIELLDAPVKVYEYDINEKSIIISLSDIMTVEGANYIKVIAEDEYTNQDSKVYTINNDFGIQDPPLLPDDIITDDDTHIMYARNQLIIFFRSGTTYDQALIFITQINGSILGYIESLETYVIKVDQNFENLSALETFAENLSATYSAIIIGVTPNYVDSGIIIDSTIPNDSEWIHSWQDNPGIQDRQWGLEAIRAQYAWDYNYYMQYTSVGVLDNGFDYNHEDLVVARTVNERIGDHGTHVAGVIGAIPNNNRGVTGIAWKSKLLGAAAGTFNELESSFTMIANLETLILSGSRVINVSLGQNFEKNYVRNGGNTVVRSKEETEIHVGATILRNRNLYTIIMNKIIDDKGYDILIVQAAGNDGSGTYDIQQFASHTGFFATVTNTLYTPYIMVVGAVQNNGNGNYSLADYSNYGSRVDVIAPGSEIYSTIANSYGAMSGTSMAAPHVTGTVAMLFSANPDLTASQVKQILIDTADITVSHSRDNTTHNMINAEEAVKEAVRLRDSNTTGVLTGRIRNALTSEPIANATLTFRYDDGNPNSAIIGTAVTTQNGSYSITLQPGTYRVFISANGFQVTDPYNVYSQRIAYVEAGETRNYSVDLTPISVADIITITMSWGAEPKDLDSHLIGPAVNGDTFHTYYANKTYWYDGELYADLDHDDIQGNGVENTTIHKLTPGTYKFVVHDYTNRGSTSSNAMSLSGVTVTIATSNEIQRTYNIPYGEGTIWTVFEFDYTGGNEIQIREVNILGFEGNPGNVGLSSSAFMLEEVYENEISEYLDYVFIDESIIDYLINLPEKFEIYN